MRRPEKESHLLEFYGVECDHCVDMEPLADQVEKEIKFPIRRCEVWYSNENSELLQKIDRGSACGGVPFFYNKKTRSWICGATTLPNLKAWATGKPHERFLPPPKEEFDVMSEIIDFYNKLRKEEIDYVKEILEFLKKLQDEGIKRMNLRTETQSTEK
ncbi:hypothetical protein CMESO_341 (nucleomorph) [Chroomonas mesostigmatica CCMP1168]|uniref:Thioredoxin domain-containing protein n=1 Tax=Chroomonas mesostigmatica CCMP1168 TaxID=1195612 RepID=J7G897_9CRYP|nr:hypothetical protein CMESO_341 [Chroomonas mesostigmatica CCMP1168]|mmetsp:Transcript_16598/g.40547  ORF Transcript_16598/g.40547 Transcript_16598/m.40547 type:complete len:158 (-) Transcript_16598:162-635(-)